MKIVFPSQPFEPRTVDAMFQGERQAAEAAGLTTLLLDSDALDRGDQDEAVRWIPQSDSEEQTIYRGWMLSADTYAALHAALARRGARLINTPAQYRTTHHLPESYAAIEDHTPRTVWTTTGATFDDAAVRALLAPFGDEPLIVKDFVKAQKHYWTEACYIPCASDDAAVKRVAQRFIELQGGVLTGGLVFREFVELEPLATHSRSGMPLTHEFRIFFLDQRPMLAAEYWEEGNYEGEQAPVDLFAHVARRIDSRFFTMDVARRRDGEWIIMELGDAQVAGLPERLGAAAFYQGLAAGRG